MERVFTCLLLLACAKISAQQFEKITTPPIGGDGVTSGYPGASWIDYDSDGDIDLFANRNILYRNDGGGAFTKLTNLGITSMSGLGSGNTWGDADNDGDPDLFISASPCGYFRNDGGTFTKVSLTAVPVADFNGWSSAWGDYDNDGDLDLFVTHPAGFLPNTTNPIPKDNFFFTNNGDGTFTQVIGTEPVTGRDAYTVGSWFDYDLDGDIDLFIGAGEVGNISPDHIFVNQLSETGTPTLKRMTGNPVGDESRDGQNWNWVDYDNDGDLDGYVTNYQGGNQGGFPNHFYRNDNGTFVKLGVAEAGDIVRYTEVSLANIWGDTDNDGDLDCILINDGQKDRYFVNNGDGTFSNKTDAFTNGLNTRGATLGDYDNDGDLDLFINAASIAERGLYRNKGNQNNWVNFTLKGTTSNRSAIGAVVRLKAKINGKDTEQLRDVNAQNSFNGHNDLRVHFGLGDATTIDLLQISWPSGIEEAFTNLKINQFCSITEGQGVNCQTSSTTEITHDGHFLRIFPNPAKADLNIEFFIAESGTVQFALFDSIGRVVLEKDLHGGPLPLKEQISVAHLATGKYTVRIFSEKTILTNDVLIHKQP